MKKAVSIIFALCVLFSGVHLTVSTHYCGDTLVAGTVSLTGEIASCGMEECENSSPVQGTHVNASCCRNIVCLYSVDNHFTPSTSFLSNSYQPNPPIFDMTDGNSLNSSPDKVPSTINEYPPGVLLSTRVDLSDICVFRI